MPGTRIRYTQEEKKNALRMCEEIGVLKASKETGISINSLYKWRMGGEGDIAAAKTDVEDMVAEEKDTRSSRKRYSAEEKEKALQLYDEVGVTKASKLTGITINSLRKWRIAAQNAIPTTPASDDEIPVEEATGPDDTQVDNVNSSTDIISRFVKIPASDVATKQEDAQLSHHILNAGGDPGEELIRLRIENASLKAQIVALKDALRVFAE